MWRSRPALLAQMRGRTTAGGLTFRSRIPTRYPIPTLTPAEMASTQSRTGMAQARIEMKTKAATMKNGRHTQHLFSRHLAKPPLKPDPTGRTQE